MWEKNLLKMIVKNAEIKIKRNIGKSEISRQEKKDWLIKVERRIR